MWDLPGPGLEPESPALAGGFLTTAPPGKPYACPFLKKTSVWTSHSHSLSPTPIQASKFVSTLTAEQERLQNSVYGELMILYQKFILL